MICVGKRYFSLVTCTCTYRKVVAFSTNKYASVSTNWSKKQMKAKSEHE